MKNRLEFYYPRLYKRLYPTLKGVWKQSSARILSIRKVAEILESKKKKQQHNNSESSLNMSFGREIDSNVVNSQNKRRGLRKSIDTLIGDKLKPRKVQKRRLARSSSHNAKLPEQDSENQVDER